MIDLLFTLALFCVFAASALMVVLIGADVYKDTVTGLNNNFDMRTSLTYVSTKIHQNDGSGVVQIGKIEGDDALILKQTYGDQVYQTVIYHDGNSLREIFASEEMNLKKSDGKVIMDVGRFEMEQVSDGLFRFISEDEDGHKAEILVSSRCA